MDIEELLSDFVSFKFIDFAMSKTVKNLYKNTCLAFQPLALDFR